MQERDILTSSKILATLNQIQQTFAKIEVHLKKIADK